MADQPAVVFYIKNYRENGSVITTERSFQTIPFNGDPVITEPKVKNELGKAGSLEFGMEMSSPLYDSLMQMKTIIRVTFFGHTIFRGRVLTIDKNLSRTRSVHCEGDFSFLMDSHQIPSKEESRKTITVLEYLKQIIGQHNADMSGDPDKEFVLGEVPGQYTSSTKTAQRVEIPNDKAKQKFGDTSWNTSMDQIENLLSDFGGYFRTRHDPVSGKTYLDWYDKYYNPTVNSQPIEITKNLIDISGSTEIENVFTVVIPIGKSNSDDVFITDYWPLVKKSHARVNYITVPELATVPLYTNDELNSGYHRKTDFQNAITRFGKIWKTVNFDNANTPQKLFNYAKDWIKNNFVPEITQWSVSALDLKIVDPQEQPLLCGDRVTLIHPEVDQSYDDLTVISVDYDLYNPDKNKYTIGIPSQQLNAAYGVAEKNSNSGKTKKGKNNDPETKKPSPKNNKKDTTDTDTKAVIQSLKGLYLTKTENGGDIKMDDPLAFLLYTNKGTEKDAKTVQKETFELNKKLLATKKKYDPLTLAVEANKRGLSVDDPQLLIELTPSAKRQQDTWKAASAATFTSDYNLSEQEADILLNETSRTSWLANLVDDDGNWTQEAIDRGALAWPQERKKQAINTRGLLNGTAHTKNGDNISGFVSSLIAGDMSAGGGTVNISFDDIYGNMKAQFGDSFNVEQKIDDATEKINSTLNAAGGIFTASNDGNGGTEFNLESNTVDIDGKNGSAGFGDKGVLGPEKHKVVINRKLTYTTTDADGKTQKHTVQPGTIAADDLHFTKTFDSARIKFGYIDEAIIDHAEILEAVVEDLKATRATIKDLTAGSVSVENWLSAYWANLKNVIIADGGYVISPSFRLKGTKNQQDLGSCFNDAETYEGTSGNERGKIVLVLKRASTQANGNTKTGKKVLFDIAATEKYIADVAAARSEGEKAGKKNVSLGAVNTSTYDPGLQYSSADTLRNNCAEAIRRGEIVYFTLTNGKGYKLDFR